MFGCLLTDLFRGNPGWIFQGFLPSNSTSPLPKGPIFSEPRRSRVGLCEPIMSCHLQPAGVVIKRKPHEFPVTVGCKLCLFPETKSTVKKHSRNRKDTPPAQKLTSLREVWLVVSQSVMESLMKPKGGCAWSKSFHQQIDQDISTFP